MKLEWGWKPGPGWGWSVRRSALVRPTLPLSIDYTAEVTLPSVPPPQLEAVAKNARLCGVRMRTAGFIDYTPAKLSVGGKRLEPGDVPEAASLPGRDATLDNGYVQFRITSAANDLALPNDAAGGYQGIYCRPRITGDRQLTAACTLVVTGQSSFAMPIVGARIDSAPKTVAARGIAMTGQLHVHVPLPACPAVRRRALLASKQWHVRWQD